MNPDITSSALFSETQIMRAAPITPSILNSLTRELLEGAFGNILIEGELSNYYRHGSGHLYFTLKDANASIRCAMFKPRAQFIRITPKDGMHVLLHARASLYETRGEFQLIVEAMDDAGVGALQREFERLKQKLSNEGLFDQSRKKHLPVMPRQIAVITSATGAAVQDVLSVLARRFPLVRVEVLSVPVQGDGAGKKIASMLRSADQSRRYEVLLLTRGGGSMEDLWAFNDETLVRTIADSLTPIVSAVGHEIDFTLADFAADVRAATPSAAAELLVPDQNELRRALIQRVQRLQLLFRRSFETRSQRIDKMLVQLQALHPRTRIFAAQVRLDSIAPRLHNQIRSQLLAQIERLRRIGIKLDHLHPKLKIERLRDNQNILKRKLDQLVLALINSRVQRLRELVVGLNSLSPLATLSRGYAVVKTNDARVIDDANKLSLGDEIEAQLARGSFFARVEKIRSE